MQFFETTIQYLNTDEEGKQKKVKESYLVDAMSFSEAEQQTLTYALECIGNDVSVIREKTTNLSEVIQNTDIGYGEYQYYKIKVKFITIDEKTGKEKKTASHTLVYAKSPEDAIKTLNSAYSNSIVDYEIDTINLTNIVYVIRHKDEK